LNQRLKTFGIWAGLLAVFAAVYVWSTKEPVGSRSLSMTEVFERAEHREYVSASIQDDTLNLILQSGEQAQADIGDYKVSDVKSYLESFNVRVQFGAPKGKSSMDSLFPILVGVFALVFALAYLRARWSGGGAGNVFSMRKTNAKLIEKPPETTFADVGGNEEAKLRLADVVGFFREPQKWQKTGARIPRGVLLEGPPGLGKTLLARALAGEAKVPLFNASGSDFVELFVGVGAARVRDLFESAAKKAPCIIFIDELDAIGRKRGSASSSLTHQEREQSLNQLLTCLDGFRPLDRVVVVAATNRVDVLDPALLRPGRFDVHLKMTALDEKSRVEVLQLHTKKKSLGPDINIIHIATKTHGFSGAELEHLTNEAALHAVRNKRDVIGHNDFELALAQKKKNETFTALDVALIEGSSQMAMPLVKTVVRVTLSTGVVEGQLVWVDPRSMKLLTPAGELLVDRSQVLKLQPLETATVKDEAFQNAANEVGVA
jgi:cell division protease FtsH